MSGVLTGPDESYHSDGAPLGGALHDGYHPDWDTVHPDNDPAGYSPDDLESSAVT